MQPGATSFRVPFRSTGRAHLHVPADLPPGPAAAVLAIHGYGRPLDEMRAFATAVAPEALVIVPEGPSAFYRRRRREGEAPGAKDVGFGWIADPDRLPSDERNDAFLSAILDEVGRRHPLDPRRSIVMGFSQGAGVATHFLLSRPEVGGALVGLAGGLAEPYRERVGALGPRPVLWVSGTRDPAYPPAYVDTLMADWRSAGSRPEALRLDTGHFLLDEAVEPVRRWLAATVLRGPAAAR